MFQTLILGALIGATMAGTPASLPNRPVATLDIARYAGTWHEIAHLPLYFQRKCIDTITATYTPRKDGTLAVHNACRTAKGMDASDGVARRVDAASGALKVRFVPGWLAWLPMVWADYWVIELDPDYRWAVVGSPSRKYLCVLSREPSMPASQFRAIRDRAQARGYPVDRLIMAAPLE